MRSLFSTQVSKTTRHYRRPSLETKSQSILTSDSGRVYKSTWNSPSAYMLVLKL